jgi:hypothetical protein
MRKADDRIVSRFSTEARNMGQRKNMAQLKHVLGSILRAVLEARISSDVSASKASRAYVRDTGLRHFPTPRVDVSSVEIDLKFTVSGLNSTFQDDPETDSTLGNIKRNQILDRNFEKFSAEIAENAIAVFARRVLHAILQELRKDEEKKVRLNEQWQNLKKKLNTGSFKEILMHQTLQFFRKKQTDLVTDDFIFDYKKASGPLIKFFVAALCRQLDATALRDQVDGDKVSNAVETAVFEKLKEMRDKILLIGSSSKAFDLRVDVAAEDLKEIEKEKVSSIKIKAVLKNYVWTRVEKLDGKVVRQLIPE